MNFKFFAVIAACLSLLQIGCASKGFNRGELRAQTGVVKPADDKEIAAALSKKPNLPKPFKVAVYFKRPAAGGHNNPWAQSRSWTWDEQDKELLVDIAKDLKATGVVADVFPILDSFVTSEDLKALRLVAAQHGADALLLIGGAGTIDRYVNNWALSYVLVVPTLFVKGSEADTLFVTNAVMYDVRNEYLYFATEAESQTNEKYSPVSSRSDKEILNEAKRASLLKLKVGIKDMVAGKKI
ncbi:MAG TPA: hypothetical protein VGE46_00665 [Bdellovibrio sp.]